MLARPGAAEAIIARAVDNYAVSEAAVRRIRQLPGRQLAHPASLLSS
jgi:hypothetical protein